MRHYLYYKSDVIMSKTYSFTMFTMRFVNKASWKWRHQLLWHVRVSSAGTTYFFENYFKAMFSFYWISVLLTLYTYLANIVFSSIKMVLMRIDARINFFETVY